MCPWANQKMSIFIIKTVLLKIKYYIFHKNLHSPLHSSFDLQSKMSLNIIKISKIQQKFVPEMIRKLLINVHPCAARIVFSSSVKNVIKLYMNGLNHLHIPQYIYHKYIHNNQTQSAQNSGENISLQENKMHLKICFTVYFGYRYNIGNDVVEILILPSQFTKVRFS